MSKLLFVTPRMADPPIGGRALLSRLHYLASRELLGDRLVLQEIEPARAIDQLRIALAGYLDGLTPAIEADILGRMLREDVSRIYIDGSNFGRLAQAVRKSLPDVEIFTFFHNVEARFFLGSFRHSKSIRAAGVLFANHRAERAAVRSSHRLLTLSSRDSALLAKVYGRGGTDILPMAMADTLPKEMPGAEHAAEAPAGNYALFVGGAFYANIEGIRWFAREVAPRSPLPTIVVGRGLEAYKAEMQSSGNVRVVGAVDRLDSWYRNAAVVIAPIFDGSGMKTKVAEALMFGKPIVGTPEAFSGYEEIAAEAGAVCETKGQFVSALAKVQASKPPAFDPRLRQLYETRFSAAALTDRLSNILAPAESAPGREYQAWRT